MNNTRHIYSERCWIEGKLQPATVSFAEGKIIGIVFSKQRGAEDMSNAVLMPGVIDAHVHINEPGRTDWEGFDTATKAAAAGGTTSIVDMPLNASPVTTSVAALHEKLDSSIGKLHVNVGFYGGLVPDNIDHLEPLMGAGVLGIKCFLSHSGIDEFPNVGKKELEAAMPLIAKYDLPLLAHCEIEEAGTDGPLNTSPTGYQQYLLSRPKKWENNAINMMIGLCRKFDCKIHIVHVSSGESLSSISDAKLEGLRITAETCPHYIYFNAENISDGNTLYKCAPPIRDAENNLLLKKALGDGTLDFIATDHSPAPASIKEIASGNFQKAWGGIAGLQFLLSSAYTALERELSIGQFIPLLTEHPAQFLKIADRKGYLKTGYDADIVIWQPAQKNRIEEKDIFHRHAISPYIGETLSGNIIETVVNGITVYRDKKIINKNAGQWLLRK